MTDQPKPDPPDGDGLEYALGALRTIAASAHDTSAKQMAAIAQAGIDLATKGPGESASERGDGPARDGAEGALPIGEDTPYWRALRAALVLPVEEQYAIAKDLAANCGYELTGDAYTAPPKPAPDAMREGLIREITRYVRWTLLSEDTVSLFERIIAALSAPVPPADGATAQDFWHELVEKTDRTSPEEYPEMALITFEELRDFVVRALSPRERPFQQRVLAWMMECFSMEICRDGTERNHRFLEESLELVQSLGCTASEAHQLVNYVFGRPSGEPTQELGGVMVTIAALCFPHQLDMNAAAETELTRVWKNIEKIRAKQEAKPKHSPLPALSRQDPHSSSEGGR